MQRFPLICLMVMPLLACGGDDTTGPQTGNGTATVATVVVTPGSAMLVSLGEMVQLTASAQDASGNTLSGKTFTWLSSDESVATVNGSGLVTALANGSVTITASSGGVTSNSVTITVQQTVAIVEVSPTNLTFTSLGDEATLDAVAQDAGGSAVSGATFTWASSDALISSVSSTGVVTAIADGMAEVTATAEGVTSNAVTVTVEIWAAVSTGRNYSCSLTPSGAAYCWGDNRVDFNASTTVRSTPVAVWLGLTFRSITIGLEHACGLTTGGEAHCVSYPSDTPVLVQGGLTFTWLSDGKLHTCGVTTGGAAYCWGENPDGQLGDGNRPNDSDTPVLVQGSPTFATVSAGANHTCGLTTSGAAHCWGRNFSGQLGNGSTGDSDTPVPVSGGLVFRSVDAGAWHTCGVTSSDEVYCWGLNFSGQLGDGNAPNNSDVPVLVQGGLSFATVSAGGAFNSNTGTCGLTTSGAAYCWGDNRFGQLGDGTGGNAGDLSSMPVAVSGGITFQSVSVAGNHVCGLEITGVAYCWGRNFQGQLGNGNLGTNSTTPVRVSGR